MNWDLLFDTPWWLPLGLGLVGMAIWISGNKRRDRALLYIGSVAIVLALAVAIVSYFVQTPRERAEHASRAFIRAVVEQQLETAEAILDPRAHVNVLGGSTQYANRTQVMAAVDRADELFGLKSATITSLRSERQGPLIIIYVDVLSVQSATMDQGFPTSWQFEFQFTGDEWKLWRITLVKAPRFSLKDAARQFPVLPRR